MGFTHRSFPPHQLHWRLRETAVGQLYSQHWQARKLACRIAAWAEAFKPDVLWVLPEDGAAGVGYELSRLLNIPLHLTLHDMHETAKPELPALRYPFYIRALDRICMRADSLDAICEPMRTHLCGRYSNLHDSNTIVFHPSTSRDMMTSPTAVQPPDFSTNVRRLGFCGSIRVSAWQWERFLAILSTLPWEIEIVAYASMEAFHDLPTPPNVTISPQPFAETEADLIDAFRMGSIHFCYMGLWREPDRALFPRTSFSAKLTTYAAAGLPVIVDGPIDMATWLLIKQYDGGLLLSDEDARAADQLNECLSDADQWREMAKGSRRMCHEHLCLEANTRRFAETLTSIGNQGALAGG